MTRKRRRSPPALIVGYGSGHGAQAFEELVLQLDVLIEPGTSN